MQEPKILQEEIKFQLDGSSTWPDLVSLLGFSMPRLIKKAELPNKKELIIEEIKRLRKLGEGWIKTGQLLGMSGIAVRYYIDPKVKIAVYKSATKWHKKNPKRVKEIGTKYRKKARLSKEEKTEWTHTQNLRELETLRLLEKNPPLVCAEKHKVRTLEETTLIEKARGHYSPFSVPST